MRKLSALAYMDLLHNTGLTPWTIVPYMIDVDNVHCNNDGQKFYIAKNIHRQYV